ncbi:MAG: heavy metal-associated domain-containing protein [Patescibacteria group bacterium]|mgnify:CR=1 FL=1
MKKITLKLSGMHCTACSVLIDTVLEELPGVKSSKTSYAEQKVEVEFDPIQMQVEKILSTIKSEGYDAVI